MWGRDRPVGARRGGCASHGSSHAPDEVRSCDGVPDGAPLCTRHDSETECRQGDGAGVRLFGTAQGPGRTVAGSQPTASTAVDGEPTVLGVVCPPLLCLQRWQWHERCSYAAPTISSAVPTGEGTLGMGEVWNGTIWHNKTQQKCAR